MSRPEPRPTLLPQNRKLRHLRGVYLRNLSFVKPCGRATDDAILSGRSPSKLEILREGGQLTHARSSESLPSLAAAASGSSKSVQKVRSRSGTLTSLGAVERQKGLEASVEARVADGFLTLHVDGEEDPVYISEVVERSAVGRRRGCVKGCDTGADLVQNFNFQFFDLNHLHGGVTRASELTVKFWARRRLDGAWSLLLENTVDLRSLSFVGSFENNLLPPNGLVFHLIDGIYSADVTSRPRRPKNAATAPTSSYNALMKMATLESSIQDALETQFNLRSQIDDGLSKSWPNKVPQQRDRAQLATTAVTTAQRALDTAETKKAEFQESLAARRAAMKEGRAVQDKAAKDVANAQEKLTSSKEAVKETKDQIHGQRRRICSELGDIFKIEPVPNGAPLSFQICGLPLPNTTYDGATSRSISEDALSAALGHVAFLVNVLQFYLYVPLPYPVTPLGSRSSVRDDIALLPTDRERPHGKTAAANPSRDFPLYLPRGGSTAAHFRFEYAWFLLNKDVEALCASQGLRVVDIRHTLPNVKYLLYVCSAGAEEIPERKRGGVRGLWMGKMKGRAGGREAEDASSSVAGSRRPSIDSTAVESELGGSPPVTEGLGLFGDRDTKMTLRTKGLREDVSR